MVGSRTRLHCLFSPVLSFKIQLNILIILLTMLKGSEIQIKRGKLATDLKLENNKAIYLHFHFISHIAPYRMPEKIAFHGQSRHSTKQIRRACCLQPKDQEKPKVVRCPSHHSSAQASLESEPLAVKTWADEWQLHNMDVGQVCLPVAATTVKPNVSLPSKGYRKCQDQQLLLPSPSEGYTTIASSLSKCLPHPQSAPEHIVQDPSRHQKSKPHQNNIDRTQKIKLIDTKVCNLYVKFKEND